MKVLIVLALFFVGLRSYGFPELIRHGYTNCIACHTSHAGGNMLTAYGRSLSRELLSQKTWFGKPAVEGDEKVAMGLVETPSWFSVGGDIRVLQSFVESREASKGRFFIMQVELNFLSEITKDLEFFFSLGRLEPSTTESSARDFIYLPRWGFDLRLSPEDQVNQLALRLGRFMPAYGINFSEHTFVTRTLLEFGPGQERHAAELSWVNDQYSVLLTGIFGQASGLKNKYEQGGILNVSRSFGEKSKVGLNFYQTEREINETKYQRKVQGAYALVGFSEKWFGLFEVDQPKDADDKYGLIDTIKLGHELFQGLNIFATQEFSNLNTEKSDPKFEAYGIGAQWFPRPHWDLYGVYRREKNTSISKEFQDVVWLVGHFYL